MCRLRNITIRDYQESVTTGQMHGQTDARQSDPYVPLCFAGDTKMKIFAHSGIQTHDPQIERQTSYPLDQRIRWKNIF